MDIRCVTTVYEGAKKITTEKNIKSYTDTDREDEIINLYPDITYQTIDGFGGAITDSAGYVFSLMDEQQKNVFLDSYFGPDGMNYNMIRIPIDSCDFSLGHYEADNDPEDAEFLRFSMDRVDKYISPLLKAVENICGERIAIILSPWSPPAYMKTNSDRNHGGSLKPEYRTRWAKYICRYIKEYRDRGHIIRAVTVQNESKAEQEWDSCVYTASEQADFVKNYLYPEMKNNGFDDVGIYVWDHNKERVLDWAQICFNEDTTDMIEGIAFHWYSGDHFDALRMVRELYPDKKLVMSEACIEFRKFDSKDILTNAYRYGHEIIGDINNGLNIFMDWNLLLDEQGGPNHAKNFCDSPFRYDTSKNVLMQTPIYSYIWHFAHFIKKGSKRIGFSSYTDSLEICALRDVSGKLILVIMNPTDKYKPAYIRCRDEIAEVGTPAGSISTCIIDGF